MSRRLLVVIVLVATAVALLLVATFGEPPNIKGGEASPCGELRDQINAAVDPGTQEALRERYERECPGHGPPP